MVAADPVQHADPGGAPLDSALFDSLLVTLGPFEARPHLAVAVSGGGDSMALCLLADDWAERQGGKVTALTVDHGLRPESEAEARHVGDWMAARRIAHYILPWRGPKPLRNRQAEARAARYALLGNWCRTHGVLHLLVGHHLEDQAETVLLRLARGSGVTGLAAMAPVLETPGVRLLRPLLGVPKARLGATLEARGQSWLEDPSNQDLSYDRTRMRRLLPVLAGQGATAARLANTAAHLGRARAALDAAAADCVARSATIFPAGYARLDTDLLREAPWEAGLRALAGLLMAIGGNPVPPRFARLDGLYQALTRGGIVPGRTLGGCRVVPAPQHGAGARAGAGCRAMVLLCREPAAVADAVAAAPGERTLWDGRFVLDLAPGGDTLSLGRLGRDGWRSACERDPAVRRTRIPAAARPSLPALRDRDGLLAVPAIGYLRDGAAPGRARLSFAPAMPAAGASFCTSAPGFSELADT